MFKEISPFGKLFSERLFFDKVDFVVEQISKGRISVMTDLDGTRIETSERALEKFNKDYRTCYTKENIKKPGALFDWAKELKIPDSEKKMVELWNSYDVMRKANPVDGIISLSCFLYSHRESKIRIPSVTSRPSPTRIATLEWHEEWMPWMDIKTNLFMQENGDDINPQFKFDTLAKYDPDYYFEDQGYDAEGVVNATENTVVILVPQPWNEDYVVPNEFRKRIVKVVPEPGLTKSASVFTALVEHTTM